MRFEVTRLTSRSVRPSLPEVFPKPLPQVSVNYVERPDIQDQVTSILFDPKRCFETCIVHGLGGSGKTQLVAYLLNKYYDR